MFAPKQNLPKYRQIRAFIAQNGSRFMSISFKKKDGSNRTINFNPSAAKNRTKGETVSSSAQQAVETRKINNPNLLNVWEQNNPDDVTKFRSINMDTVYQIKAGKHTLNFYDVA